MLRPHKLAIWAAGIAASLLLCITVWSKFDSTKLLLAHTSQPSVVTITVQDVLDKNMGTQSTRLFLRQQKNAMASATLKNISREYHGVNQNYHQDQKLEKRMPKAIVVGAGKCGTDALITYLNTSDEFVIDTIPRYNMDELNYFNYNYFQGNQWYIDNMPPSRKNQITIEKCAPYLWNVEVPERVYRTNPDMKLIFVFCDPVKRTVSLYTHINSYLDDTNALPSFTKLVYIDSETGQLKENVHPKPAQPFLECSKYVVFVKQWLKYFPMSQMVFVNGERLITEPLLEVRKVTSFLGKPNSVTEDNLYFNASRGYYCFAKNDGEKWCMDKNTKGRKHPNLPFNLITAMHNHYKPFNEQLYELVGINFSWPKYFGNNSHS